jgi:23S rRNA (cytidine1920-2'-O)/16S rRNA (cytidine1409-2'-O)-methyltransferase
VREAEAREEARTAVLAAAGALGFVVRGSCDSPIAGQDGNLEFLVWLGWERAGVPEDRSERSGS